MFDALEILRIRRRKSSTPTFLQICWCAATKKKFIDHEDIYKVTPQEADSVNFIQLCSDIEKMLFNRETRVRFNLTIGSQLTYGTLRIFEYQAETLKEKSENMRNSMFDFDYSTNQEAGGKKKNPKKDISPIEEQSFSSIQDFSDVDINELFGEDEHRKDEHIIEEVDEFLETESHLSFQVSEVSSDIEKVMQELYEEMQRPQKRSRRVIPENLRQTITRRSRRLSRSSTSESAKTAVTPPSSQRSGSDQQLQTSVFAGEPASQMEQQFDAPPPESEVLPEAAIPDEPPLSQSSVAAIAAPAVPSPPLPEISAITESSDPQENFPTIEEGHEAINVITNIDRNLFEKNLTYNEEKQILLPKSPKSDMHTRKVQIKVNLKRRKIAQIKVPAKTLLTTPSSSCIGSKKVSSWSKFLTKVFINTIWSTKRTLKTTEVTVEFENPAETQGIEEEEIEHSPPKIIKTAEPAMTDQHLNSDSNAEVPAPDTAIPAENDAGSPAGRFDPPEPMETNIAEVNQSQVEDNDCEDRRVANRSRKKSSSFFEENQEEEPKSKHPKVQETDEDLQSESVMSKSDMYNKIKSFWRSVRESKGRSGANVKVNFRKIVPPAKRKITDVISSLTLCFHLEKDGKITIEQERPYRPLYLVKPST